MATIRLSYQSVSFVISLLSLSFAMACWPNLFLFAKSVHLPAWAESLSSPINAPKYVTFLCLIPLAFSQSKLFNTGIRLSKIILLASIVPVVFYILETSSQDIRLIYNVIFQYFWVIGWNCTLPALALLVLNGLCKLIANAINRQTTTK